MVTTQGDEQMTIKITGYSDGTIEVRNPGGKTTKSQRRDSTATILLGGSVVREKELATALKEATNHVKALLDTESDRWPEACTDAQKWLAEGARS